MLPESIQKFISQFSKLPSLGPRAATRLAFFIANLNRSTLEELINAFLELKKLNKCKKCFFIKENNKAVCSICSDSTRDKKTIAIIEKETDLLSIEKASEFRGVYFIIGELSDKDVLETEQKMRLQYLKTRIKNELDGKAKEIILAVNPNVLSDILYDLILGEFKCLAEKITRLGRGIPTGGEIEFSDPETLRDSLKRRF